MKRKSYTYISDGDKKMIEQLGAQGTPDIEIAKIYKNTSIAVITKITTDFWKSKMKHRI